MNRFIVTCLFAALAVVPAAAQAQSDTGLVQAQQVLLAAETANAPVLAKSIYEDAMWRLRFAQTNWNAEKRNNRDMARLRAAEALWAGRAALAKSQWLGTNAAIRGLQSDITRWGGRSDLTVADEAPDMDFNRGTTSRARADAAQAAINMAKAAGADQMVVGGDLKTAQSNVETARKIVRANSTSESADHLSYVAEMMARRAFYLARATEAGRYLPTLQFERTRLAQSASEQQAAADRAQRQEAERQSADLQRQLAIEQANRQAQSSELDKLRQQLDENRQAMDQRVTTDRAAREEAEKRLDDAIQRYQKAIASASTADAENLRRQVEDQQIALRAIQERERMNEQSMSSQLESLRTELSNARSQGTASAQVVADREAELTRRQQELETLRKQREEDMSRRQDLDRQQQTAIADAQRRRQELEAQAQELKLEVEKAQQATQQTQAELDRQRQQTQQTQAELERTRMELAQRDVEARRMKMQQELGRLASTRSDQGRLIVTLPGIFFDTGKSALKPGARNTLKRIADQLRTDDTIRIAIEGHTDSVGSEESNQQLSESRSNAVRDYLVSSGLTTGHITSAGKGEADPVATNKTVAGRQQNRRVELIITNE